MVTNLMLKDCGKCWLLVAGCWLRIAYCVLLLVYFSQLHNCVVDGLHPHSTPNMMLMLMDGWNGWMDGWMDGWMMCACVCVCVCVCVCMT